MATQADFLQWFQRAAQEIQTPSEKSKRQVRNSERRSSHRLVSKRQQAALRQTKNPVRAAYMSAEQATRQAIDPDTDERSHTRNVGPSDLPRSTSGKQTIGPRTY
jgi:hypothetical protein